MPRITVITGFALVWVFCVSCNSRLADSAVKMEENAITALRETADSGTEAAAGGTAENSAASRLVLEQGNYWTAGIPGFGGNALSAFTGQYRIPGKNSTVQVWLTREFLYYEGWERRGSQSTYVVLQKIEGISRLAAVTTDIWTIVALFPGEVTKEEEDILVALFIDRFSGLSGQIQNISLPALLPYQAPEGN